MNAIAPALSAPTSWMLAWLERLCAFDTTTGREDQGLDALRQLLAELGAEIELQPVHPGRTNVLATWGEPELLFSTHLDTVPPYLPPRREPGALWGRGSCDAKGQIALQAAVIRELLSGGRRGLAWLGVIGEETDSSGAIKALELAPRFQRCRALVNGEPTGNALATGQRGIQHLQLSCTGVAAHSGTPERGRSAIWELLEWLARARALPGRTDPELGPEIWNLGLIRGGEAPNVVPAAAEASLFVRTLPGSRFQDELRRLAPEGSRVELKVETPPDRYPRLEGFRHAPVPFGSDAPKLRALVPDRSAVLVGPGRIELAHGLDEHIDEAELAQGFEVLLAIARHFLPARAA